MKIQENREETKFRDVLPGETFKYDGQIYLKIASIRINGELVCNAVRLKDGGPMCWISSTREVILVNGAFVVES